MPLNDSKTGEIRVLFVCIHNSARSQMAEAFLNAAPGFTARSAGLEAGRLNPIVVAAMAEIGFDISNNAVKTIDDVLGQKAQFDFVITVCDEASAQRCPVVPGAGQRLHWSFEDPSAFNGPTEERLRATRTIRDAIRARVGQFCREQQPAVAQ